MSKNEYVSKGLARKLIRKAQTEGTSWAVKALEALPTIEVGLCSDCKYFETDLVAKVDGVPLIVAHEMCTKWGDGCKTRENGWCFLFEPKEGKNESE